MRILCFGDSNTYGYDPRGYFGGRYDHPWPELLAEKTGHEIINAGENGREIPPAAFVPGLVSSCKPFDLLILMLGTNDLLQGASAAVTASRMEAALRALLPHCPKILLTAPPPMKRGAWVPEDTLVSESHHLADQYRLLAESLSLPFADTRGWEISLAYDGVHFTEEGHRAFASRLSKYLP